MYLENCLGLVIESGTITAEAFSPQSTPIGVCVKMEADASAPSSDIQVNGGIIKAVALNNSYAPAMGAHIQLD